MSIKRKSKRTGLVIRILKPGECSANDLQAFASLVRQGAQVSVEGLEARIASAAWLGFAWLGEKLAGVAALKKPRDSYRSKVFSAAQVVSLAPRYPLEFGYLFIVPEFEGQGIAKKLLRELLAKNSASGTFATAGADKEKMRSILSKSGFIPLGAVFPSSRRERSICLWGHTVSSNSNGEVS